MSETQFTSVVPEGWQRGRGYAHAVAVETAKKLVFIAGQVATKGGDNQNIVSEDFVVQWDQCLANFKTVVEAAGGTVESVVALRIFVTDVNEYQTNLAATGEPYKRHFGRHFPAITLVGVTGLAAPGAKIEIEGTAAI